MSYEAVIFDLGGVVFPSPIAQFDVYNDAQGLPPGFVRELINMSSQTGAWAAHERGELTMTAFCAALEAEAVDAGHEIDAAALLGALAGDTGAHPDMLEAIAIIRAAGLRTAALTNNWRADPGEGFDAAISREALFDVVVESAVEGMRKPDTRIYELVLDRLGVGPNLCVYLDDLGINLKPARAMGMHTIKVVDQRDSLRELGDVLGLPLLDAT